MGKPHPIELRERVVAFVEEGNTHRATARHFRVSPRFVNNMVILKRETGSLEPKRQGHGGNNGKLKDQGEWVRRRLAENGDLTLDELVFDLAERGVRVHRSSVGRLLHRLGLSHKKKACRPVNASVRTLPASAIYGRSAAGPSSTGPCRGSCSLMKPRPTRN